MRRSPYTTRSGPLPNSAAADIRMKTFGGLAINDTAAIVVDPNTTRAHYIGNIGMLDIQINAATTSLLSFDQNEGRVRSEIWQCQLEKAPRLRMWSRGASGWKGCRRGSLVGQRCFMTGKLNSVSRRIALLYDSASSLGCCTHQADLSEAPR